MRVTYDWLKEFVDIKIPALALAEKLTMAGLEVVSLEERAGDFIFEIEITSNRPDWLSVIGVAREVAAITGRKLKLPSSTKRGMRDEGRGTRDAAGWNIRIEDRKDCPLYTARIIRGVKVGPSPEWLKKRLESVGCRSVNNIVDITNYVLFQLGEPLHAFDLDKLSGDAIIVRRALNNEKLVTIDGIQRVLSPEILLIADTQKPVAIAGVMGSQNSEVTRGTCNILLEAAVFNPVIVRSARQRLGLESESSYRFERGVDSRTASDASQRAAGLICELCGGELVAAKSSGSDKVKLRRLTFDLSASNRLLGIKLPAAKAKKILSALGFKLASAGKDKLAVSIPAFRQDVSLEVDLTEELARMYGYDKIPVTVPKVTPVVFPNAQRNLVRKTRDILIGLGLNEAVTYSLVDQESAKGLSDDAPVTVANPLSSEQAVLRSTLIPGLLKSVAMNLNQKQQYVSIFEIANIFRSQVPAPLEGLSLGMVFCGERVDFIAEYGMVKIGASLMHLKGVLETLLSRLGLQGCQFARAGRQPGEFVIMIAGELLGRIFEVNSAVLQRFEIKGRRVFAAEINLARAFQLAKEEKRFKPLPLYPAIARDISFLVKEGVAAAKILECVGHEAGELLEEVKVIDYYKGKQIPAGLRALTISCVYRSRERTLTEEEINPVHASVVAAIKEQFSAQLR